MLAAIRVFELLVSLMLMGGETANSPPSDSIIVYNNKANPDAVFQSYYVDDRLYWNRPPRGIEYSDVAEKEKSCVTRELLCIESPFPLVIPRRSGERARQEVTEGELTYYALTGRSGFSTVCEADRFTVVTSLKRHYDPQQRWYEYTFSRLHGLERIIVMRENAFGDPSVEEIFTLVSGRIYAHREICE